MKLSGICANGVPRTIRIPQELQPFQHLAAKVPHFTEIYQNSPNFTIWSGISLKSHPKCENYDFSRSGLTLVIPELICLSRTYVIPQVFHGLGRLSAASACGMGFPRFQEIHWNHRKCVNSHNLLILKKILNSNRIRASGPFRIVDIPKELLMFSRLGRRRSGKPINSHKML